MDLEAKYEECNSRKTKTFPCNNCDETFRRKKDIQKHREIHYNVGVIQCQQCDKTFDQEWKIKAHIKIHKSYSCNQCGKTFNFENLLQIHNKVDHEGVKLFCHYFNNNQDCPHEDECVFLHEHSVPCRYRDICEREFCMYKHNEVTNDGVEEDDGNTTFVNPSQKENVHDNSLEATNNDKTELFKCDICVYTAETKTQVENHNLIHCCICSKLFTSKNRKKHINMHKNEQSIYNKLRHGGAITELN